MLARGESVKHVSSRIKEEKSKRKEKVRFKGIPHSLFQYPVGYSIFVKLGGLSYEEQRVALAQMLDKKLSTEEAMGVIKTLKQERYAQFVPYDSSAV